MWTAGVRHIWRGRWGPRPRRPLSRPGRAGPAGVLLPGMYVRVRLDQAEANNAILLPQQAVTRSTTGDTVMVVSQDGKVAPRPVKVGTSQGTNWVVLDGLKPGEQVMVDGFQKLQMLPPGTPVKPVPWTPAGTQAPAQAGAPAAQPNAAGAQAAAGANASGARTPSSGSPAAGATTPANSSR